MIPTLRPVNPIAPTGPVLAIKSNRCVNAFVLIENIDWIFEMYGWIWLFVRFLNDNIVFVLKPDISIVDISFRIFIKFWSAFVV